MNQYNIAETTREFIEQTIMFEIEAYDEAIRDIDLKILDLKVKTAGLKTLLQRNIAKR